MPSRGTLLGMTTLIEHLPETSAPTATDVDLEALATREFRRALTVRPALAREACVRVSREGNRARIVAELPTDLPWRVADAAVVRAIRALREASPGLQVVDTRFAESGRAD